MKRLQLREDVQAEIRALLLLTLTLNLWRKTSGREFLFRDVISAQAERIPIRIPPRQSSSQHAAHCQQEAVVECEAVGFVPKWISLTFFNTGPQDGCLCLRLLRATRLLATNENSPIVILTHPEKGLGGCRGNLQNFSGFFTRTPCRKFGMHRHAGPFCDPVGAKRIASVRGKQRTLCGLTSSPPTLRMN